MTIVFSSHIEIEAIGKQGSFAEMKSTAVSDDSSVPVYLSSPFALKPLHLTVELRPEPKDDKVKLLEARGGIGSGCTEGSVMTNRLQRRHRIDRI